MLKFNVYRNDCGMPYASMRDCESFSAAKAYAALLRTNTLMTFSLFGREWFAPKNAITNW